MTNVHQSLNINKGETLELLKEASNELQMVSIDSLNPSSIKLKKQMEMMNKLRSKRNLTVQKPSF